MKRPAFEDLPFYERPDLTPYLIHLTKNTKKEDGYSAYDNLISILERGKIWGSSRESGFIKGPNKAVCFMDVPFVSLKYVLNKDNTDPSRPRYEPFGVFITKKFAYKRQKRGKAGSVPFRRRTQTASYSKGRILACGQI